MSLTAVNMSPRKGVDIGRRRPKANAVLLEEIWSLCARMDTMEIARRRIVDEAVHSAAEE